MTFEMYDPTSENNGPIARYQLPRYFTGVENIPMKVLDENERRALAMRLVEPIIAMSSGPPSNRLEVSSSKSFG